MNHNDFSHLNQIVYMDFGSHLYGTMTPTSDFDFKGIHIPQPRKSCCSASRNLSATGSRSSLAKELARPVRMRVLRTV